MMSLEEVISFGAASRKLNRSSKQYWNVFEQFFMGDLNKMLSKISGFD